MSGPDEPKGGRASVRTWSVDELRAFLAHVREERLYGVWVLAATTGLRPSEHSAVRWQDLDFDTALLTVRQRLATAGGLHEYARSRNILVMRTEKGRQVAYKFNYRDILSRKNLWQNIELLPGDTVVVP